ncbi:heterokaryon incompatibility protein-domain-containing protein [Leptodontidium sp. MPI-SDFR-AT-0119]|nr:heterokaryon incompatibility protein-domain-containing protein [Leptodontidium sp. MPI-SDFR-AT-0119]
MSRRNSAPARLPPAPEGELTSDRPGANSNVLRPGNGLQPHVLLPHESLQQDRIVAPTEFPPGQEITCLRGPYQYQSLKPEALEIRLLTLLPGPFDSEIRITVTPVTFAEDSDISFEALSYTWGSPENPVDIFIGKHGYNTLPVTRNLAEALPHLRYPDKPRVLWIDAICVNQQNIEERSSQVKRMANIYSKATRVLIWLGPVSDDSRMAIDCLKRISSKYHVDWMTWSIEPVTKDGSWWATPGEMLPLSDEQNWSILHLISRDWFERLWILQEAHLANREALVVCGTDNILWENVCEAMFCIRKKPYPSYIYKEFSERLGHILGLFLRKDAYRFPNLIDDTRFCKYTDPRDRVFAILGLLGPSGNLGIEPDYTKTTSGVYQDAAWKHIEYTASFEVLRGIEYHDTEGLPSWAPDLTKRRKANPFSLCNASGQSTAHRASGPGGILHVLGIRVSVISRSEPFDFAEFETAGLSVLPKVRLVVDKLGLEKSQEDISALCEVICANDFTSRRIPKIDTSLDQLQTEQLLRTILESKDYMSEAYRNEKFFAKVQTHAYGRSLYITEDGYVGLAPEATQPGDIVVVMLGCDSPLVLRPVTSDAQSSSMQQYKVVGESYCHGIMNNEAILGPLPAGFDVVNHLIGGKGFRTKYLDRETGQLLPEDPRLGAFPVPWKSLPYDEDRGYPMYFNEETERRTGNDPRLDGDVLMAMGVELEILELI